MAITLALELVVLFVVSTVVLSVFARLARITFRRRFDLGVVSQRWLLTHRAED